MSHKIDMGNTDQDRSVMLADIDCLILLRGQKVGHAYKMGDSILESSLTDKDLQVTVDN